MNGFVAGKVLHSENENWKVNDLFGATLPFSTYIIVGPELLKQILIWKLTDYITEDKISYGIGVLGMPGATVYGGLVDTLRPLQGETIFISAAAGAVGGMVGQLAKALYNCKVIGSCGGTAKGKLITEEWGFDHAIDYKTLKDKDELVAALKAVAPEGIDIYFENVGGIHFAASMECLNNFGRVAVCGMIDIYNDAIPEPCNFWPMKMIYSSQRVEGFISFAWLSGKKGGDWLGSMHKWLSEGKINIKETTTEGIENWPHAFISLFEGGSSIATFLQGSNYRISSCRQIQRSDDPSLSLKESSVGLSCTRSLEAYTREL
jgi:NADPH-dependent curcumin reductase CurA